LCFMGWKELDEERKTIKLKPDYNRNEGLKSGNVFPPQLKAAHN
jgi:hypothetical protein